MKIVFLGTPDFAVPSLKALVESVNEVVAVVCQPDKPIGRKKKLTRPPTKIFAESLNIPVLQPPKIKNNEEFLEELKSHSPELICVTAYGKILPKDVLDLPPNGCINVHASILPKYRGAAPINWSIINGEARTGVTTMLMDEGMDTGDVLLIEETAIEYNDTSESLSNRLSRIGAELLLKTINKLISGSLKPIKQNDSEASLAPMLKKEHGEIDWSKSSKEIRNLVRGLLPWPVAFTHLDKRMFKIFNVEESDGSGPPGTVIESNKNVLKISTGKGSIKLLEVQLEGNKRMDIKSFLMGKNIEEGTLVN